MNEKKYNVLAPDDPIRSTPEFLEMRQRVDAIKTKMRAVKDNPNLSKDQKRAQMEQLLIKLQEDQKIEGKDYPKRNTAKEVKEAQEVIPDLKEQYEQRLATLEKIGFTYDLPSGEHGFLDINNEERPIPTLDQIAGRINQKMELLTTKVEQGLIYLQITPFGQPLSNLTKKTGELILNKHKQGKLKSTKGDNLALDTSTPLWVWGGEEANNGQKGVGYDNADISGSLVYYPKQFDPNNHQGQTKQDLLEDNQFLLDGYLITIHEGKPDLPDANAAKEQTKGGRTPLAADGTTPTSYLKKLRTEEQYQGENGQTPEEWLTYLATHLEETDQVIDDYGGQGKASYNLGGFFPHTGSLSNGYWFRGDRQACLGGGGPGDSFDSVGVRSSVNIWPWFLDFLIWYFGFIFLSHKLSMNTALKRPI